MLPSKLFEHSTFTITRPFPLGRTGILDCLPIEESSAITKLLDEGNFVELEARFLPSPEPISYPTCFLSRFYMMEFGKILAHLNPTERWIIGVTNTTDLTELKETLALETGAEQCDEARDALIVTVESAHLVGVMISLWQSPQNEFLIIPGGSDTAITQLSTLLKTRNARTYGNLLRHTELVASKSIDDDSLALLVPAIEEPVILHSLRAINRQWKTNLKQLSDRIEQLLTLNESSLRSLALPAVHEWIRINESDRKRSINAIRLIGLCLLSESSVGLLIKCEAARQNIWLMAKFLCGADGVKVLEIEHCESVHWSS